MSTMPAQCLYYAYYICTTPAMLELCLLCLYQGRCAGEGKGVQSAQALNPLVGHGLLSYTKVFGFSCHALCIGMGIYTLPSKSALG